MGFETDGKGCHAVCCRPLVIFSVLCECASKLSIFHSVLFPLKAWYECVKGQWDVTFISAQSTFMIFKPTVRGWQIMVVSPFRRSTVHALFLIVHRSYFVPLNEQGGKGWCGTSTQEYV